MQRKRQLTFLFAVIVMCFVSWAMSTVYEDMGTPFVPQQGSGLLPNNQPVKCWVLTLRADGTYGAVEAPCKHQDKKP